MHCYNRYKQIAIVDQHTENILQRANDLARSQVFRDKLYVLRLLYK